MAVTFLTNEDKNIIDEQIAELKVNGGGALNVDAEGNATISGGEGGSVGSVDVTLTQEGMAADAKATGDAINLLSEQISDTANDSVYELIETITVEEEMAIERTQEPDGTPYAFDALFIKIEGTPTSTQALNVWVFNNTQRIAGGYQSFTANKTTRGACEVKKQNGYWRSENHPQNTSSTAYQGVTLGGSYYTLKYPITRYPYITSWKTQDAVVPAGVTIEIWGVRTNA